MCVSRSRPKLGKILADGQAIATEGLAPPLFPSSGGKFVAARERRAAATTREARACTGHATM